MMNYREAFLRFHLFNRETERIESLIASSVNNIITALFSVNSTSKEPIKFSQPSDFSNYNNEGD